MFCFSHFLVLAMCVQSVLLRYRLYTLTYVGISIKLTWSKIFKDFAKLFFGIMISVDNHHGMVTVG